MGSTIYTRGQESYLKLDCGEDSELVLIGTNLEACDFKEKDIDEMKKAARGILDATGLTSPPICLHRNQASQIQNVLQNKKERRKIIANPFPMAAYIQTVKLRCHNCIIGDCEDRDPNFPLEEQA